MSDKKNIEKNGKVYTATLRYARISPRKVNYVAELIRGLSANRALEVLMFSQRRASYFLYKLLKSAISNAVNQNDKIDVDKLYLKEVVVNGGPIMKRMGSAPRGRAVLIRRRFAHITISLVEAQEISKEREKQTKQPKIEKKERTETASAQLQTQQSSEQKSTEIDKTKTETKKIIEAESGEKSIRDEENRT